MSLETSAVRRFDGFELDMVAHELRRQGTRIRLQEQPFQILSLLLEHAGRVVTREELRRKVWPSSVYVDFDHGLNNAIARLRDALGDDREAPRYIETLPRIGYRFVCQVDQTAAPPAHSDGRSANDGHTVLAPPAPVTTASGWRRNPRRLTGAALVLLGAVAVVLIVSAGHWRSPPAPSGPALADPSLAVLPFANLSSDKENEYFADGLTEALVTKLAAIHGLKVVARTSSYRFKGRQESAGAIAQALHVNHLLEGSVSRAGTQLRITAQLIDARSDAHLWSQTFDRRAGDIFKIQDDIAFAVVAALKVSLLDTEEFRLRSHGTSDPEAYRLYLIAHSHLAGGAQTGDRTVGQARPGGRAGARPEVRRGACGAGRLLLPWRVDQAHRHRRGRAARDCGRGPRRRARPQLQRSTRSARHVRLLALPLRWRLPGVCRRAKRYTTRHQH